MTSQNTVRVHKDRMVSQEWWEEIARRCREIDEGVVDLIPGDRVLKEAAEGLDE